MKQARSSKEILAEIRKLSEKSVGLLQSNDGPGLQQMGERVKLLCKELSAAYARENKTKSNADKLEDLLTQLPDDKQAVRMVEILQSRNKRS